MRFYIEFLLKVIAFVKRKGLKIINKIFGVRLAEKIIIIISSVLYIVCLSIPAVSDRYGLAYLFWGVLGIPSGHFAWIGNPLLFFSWFLTLTNKFKHSLYVSVLALIFMASISFYEKIPVSMGNDPLVILQLGYYFWIASTVIISLFCLIQLIYKGNKLL